VRHNDEGVITVGVPSVIARVAVNLRYESKSVIADRTACVAHGSGIDVDVAPAGVDGDRNGCHYEPILAGATTCPENDPFMGPTRAGSAL
jgi:hypothetical protein